MRRIEAFNAGWTQSSISDVVAAKLLARFHSVLITVIDSSGHVASCVTGERILAAESACVALGMSLIVPGARLAHVAAAFNLFNGFDEVWCFDRTPTTPGPGDLSIVAPLNLGAEEAPHGLGAWMATADCRLALGDGVGLNFAAWDSYWADALSALAARTA